MCRVIDAAKARATQGSAGAPSDGERDAHELLRTLVRTLKVSLIAGGVYEPTALVGHPAWFQGTILRYCLLFIG